MHKIITVGRNFGSGGREVGRRLAERLGIAYYDHEIVKEMAKRTNLTEEYISQIEESRTIPLLPITIGTTFSPQFYPMLDQSLQVFTEQSKIIKEMAEKSDCVIVGRCADYLLRDKKPLRLFIYADMEYRIRRCRERGDADEDLSDRALRSKILGVDKERSRYYQLYTNQTWGARENYDLCINTTHMDIKELVEALAMFIEADRNKA